MDENALEVFKLLQKGGVSVDRAKDWAPILAEACLKYGITGKHTLTCFIATVLVESGNLTRLEENLNYSAKRLVQIWPSRFNPVTALQYANKPEKIANTVYQSRNGNLKVGYGWKYRGRGLIQLTFYDNYLLFEKETGIPATANPDLLLQPEIAAESAAWFWKRIKVDDRALKWDLEGIRRKVNGGNNGLQEFKDKANKLIK